MIKLMGSPGTTFKEHSYDKETLIYQPLYSSDYDPDKALGLLSNFSDTVPKIRNHPDEFEWNMQNAQAFITSVQTTTGKSQVEKYSILEILSTSNIIQATETSSPRPWVASSSPFSTQSSVSPSSCGTSTGSAAPFASSSWKPSAYSSYAFGKTLVKLS